MMQAARTLKIKSSKLYELRMKYERATVTDFKGVADSIGKSIEEQYQETGAFPPVGQLDMLAGILDHVAENLVREALERDIMNRTAEEWRRLEHHHVERADFTLSDLVDMLLSQVESGKITREEMSEIRRKYKPCAHRFCLNYFIPSRKDKIYCDGDCRKAESNAVAEFRRTSKLYKNGTYLPVYAYKDIRDKQEKENYAAHERLFEPFTLELIGTKKEESIYEYDGRRNRKNEERASKARMIDKETKAAEAMKPGAVEVTRKSREEIDQYFRENYSERKLKLSRKYALEHGKAPKKLR